MLWLCTTASAGFGAHGDRDEPVNGLIVTCPDQGGLAQRSGAYRHCQAGEALREAAHRAGMCGFVPKESLFEIRHWLAI